ncbi:hypothetical protein OE749_03595 [Aestuariibacter sp. AA17]|uniref:Uncharacterized protein n=1 Tax=Fluctibacter corallii TaxID=2984329 RepID=A0ABT3A604_9ALTE|nr:hypothetical protein [Aestuariibacter sp. AA17]MCV2883786.1 hypothetical protein [Aestuariibacter sp. AA17]
MKTIKIPYLTGFILLGLCGNTASAHSLYIGAGQSEQTASAGPNSFDFTPWGYSVYGAFNATDNLILSADIYTANEKKRLSRNVEGEVDIHAWSIGASYFLDNWTWSFSYAGWEDELTLHANFERRERVDQATDAPSLSASVAYDWQLDNWQISSTLGLHRAEWEKREHRFDGRRSNTSLDEGHSTFASVSLSASHAWHVESSRFVVLGASVRWNEALNDESEAVSRNGRNVNQIQDRFIRNMINAQAAVGSESYGQMSTYFSYDIIEDWSVDVSISRDFGTTVSSTSWSLNVGHQF